MPEKYRHTLSFDYPDDIHGHMIDPKQTRNEVLDENFKYYDKKLKFFNRLIHFLFMILIFPITWIRYGVKRKGIRRLRGYKKQLKGGFFTTCNHIFEWDYLIVRSCFYFKRGYMTVWKNNHNSSMGPLMRKVGSIPIPESKSLGMAKFYEDVKECVDDGNMVHFYPEASMWYYYQGLREFKPGCFVLAAKCNKPVVPLAISFRPAKGLYKLWKRKGYPTCTVEVGKPIFPDNSLEFKDCVNKLKDDCYKATKEMMEKNTPIIKEK